MLFCLFWRQLSEFFSSIYYNEGRRAGDGSSDEAGLSYYYAEGASAIDMIGIALDNNRRAWRDSQYIRRMSFFLFGLIDLT